jgi:hypothetical protein
MVSLYPACLKLAITDKFPTTVTSILGDVEVIPPLHPWNIHLVAGVAVRDRTDPYGTLTVPTFGVTVPCPVMEIVMVYTTGSNTAIRVRLPVTTTVTEGLVFTAPSMRHSLKVYPVKGVALTVRESPANTVYDPGAGDVTPPALEAIVTERSIRLNTGVIVISDVTVVTVSGLDVAVEPLTFHPLKVYPLDGVACTVRLSPSTI